MTDPTNLSQKIYRCHSGRARPAVIGQTKVGRTFAPYKYGSETHSIRLYVLTDFNSLFDNAKIFDKYFLSNEPYLPVEIDLQLSNVSRN